MTFTERTPIEAGFAPVYEAEIAPKLDALEAARLKARRTATVRFFLAFGVLAGLGAVIWLATESLVALLAFAIMGLVVGLILGSMAVSAWKGQVAEAVMPVVCRFLGDLDYSGAARGGFPVGAMRDLGLIGAHNMSSLTHKLTGRWRGTAFEAVQANLRQKTKTSGSGTDSHSSTRVVFQGLLFRIDVPESAPTRILIAKEYGRVGKAVASVFGAGPGRSMPRVETRHPRFEEFFEVHAANPEAARRFLPHGFLDTLLEIGETEGGRRGAKGMTAGFVGRDFYLALSRGMGFLDLGNADKPVQDIAAQLHDVFEEITLVRRIIDRLHGIAPDPAGGAPQ